MSNSPTDIDIHKAPAADTNLLVMRNALDLFERGHAVLKGSSYAADDFEDPINQLRADIIDRQTGQAEI